MKPNLSVLAGIAACCYLALPSITYCESIELSSYTKKVVRDTQQSLLASIPIEGGELSPSPKTGRDEYQLPKQTRQLLDTTSGPHAHAFDHADWGENLAGAVQSPQKITVHSAIFEAAAHNLDGRIASLLPASRETEVVEASAAFDWEAFASTSYGRTDTPQPVETINGIPVELGEVKQEKTKAEAGLRKKLGFGGSVEMATGFSVLNDLSADQDYLPDPAFLPQGTLAFTLPLLRNAGSVVNESRIVWAANTKVRDRFEALRSLSQAILDTETAYWELSYAHFRLAVARNLLKQTRETYEALKARSGVDVKPVQLSQAWSYVLSRGDEVLQAQLAVRAAGDRLKEIMNSPEHALVDETVLVPVDRPAPLPTTPHLEFIIQTALENNPKLGIAQMELENSQVEWNVADLQRRPQLDLKLEGGMYGIGDKASSAYSKLEDARYTGGSAMVVFSVPLGNRAADAVYERSRLTKKSRELAYLKTARDVVRSAKEALRELRLASRLASTSREGRIAAAEHLRTLIVREKETEPLTAEFLLNLKLDAQRRLAEAEMREFQALANFHTSLAKLHHECGDLLAEHGLGAPNS